MSSVSKFETLHAPILPFSTSSPRTDLALLHELLHAAHGLAKRHAATPVQQVEVEVVGAEGLERVVAGVEDVGLAGVAGQHLGDDVELVAVERGDVGASSRCPARASPTRRSLRPLPYISAVSMSVIPPAAPRRSASASESCVSRWSPTCKVPWPSAATLPLFASVTVRAGAQSVLSCARASRFACVPGKGPASGRAGGRTRRRRASAASLFPVCPTVLLSGVVVGVMQESGMLDAMVQAMMAVVPSAMGPNVYLIIAALSTPLMLLFTNDTWFYALMPLVAVFSAHYGVPPRGRHRDPVHELRLHDLGHRPAAALHRHGPHGHHARRAHQVHVAQALGRQHPGRALRHRDGRVHAQACPARAGLRSIQGSPASVGGPFAWGTAAWRPLRAVPAGGAPAPRRSRLPVPPA